MGTLACPLCCDEEFPSQLSLRYHLLSITDNVYCPDCSNRFDSILQLADHLDGMCGKAHIESNFEDDTSESDMIIAEGSVEEGEIDTQVVTELNNTENITAEYLEEAPNHTLPDASETHLDNSGSIQLVCDTDIEETAVNVIENDYVDVIEQKIEVIHIEDDARDPIEIDATDGQSRYVAEETIGAEEKLSENLSVLPTSNVVEVDIEECDEEMVGSKSHAVPEIKEDALVKQEERGEYACSSCGITFSSVMEHIRLYHDGQEVVVEVPDADKEAFDKLVGTSNEIVASNDEERMDSNVLLECSDSKHRSDSEGAVEGTNNELGSSETAFCPERYSASKRASVKPYHWHKEKTRVVADEEKIKQIVPCVKKFLMPLDTTEDHVTGELKCVSKEVKIDKFWETKFDEDATLDDVNGTNIKKENRRMLVKKDTRTSIEKLFSGNFLLKGTGGRGTRPGPYLGVSRVPEVKVIMSPGDKGTENAISVFTCSTCQKEFGNVPAFERHSCTVAKMCSMVCKLCDTDISDIKAMRIHMETVHNMKTENPNMAKRKYNMQTLSQPVKCGSCDMTFTTMRALKLHGKMHDRVDAKAPLECPVCHNVCSSNRTLKQHMKVHSKPLPLKKPDDSTGAEDEDPVVRSDKGGMLGLLVCKVCYKSFSKNEDLRAHWQEHSNKDVGGGEGEEEKPLEQLVEVIKEEVGLPENQSEETKKKTVPCAQCHKEIDKSCKEEHMAKHFSLLRYDCPVCNKSFSKHGHLNMHMRIHRGVKEYSCIHCGKVFANMNLLRTHIQSHMIQRPYLCGFCGRGFFRPHDKVEHERIHTGEKPYPCSVCGMRFRVRYCLTLHMRRHTGIRPYNCKMCDKTFRTGTAYKAHIKIHLDERAYKCPFCPKKFNTMIQLAGHKNSHTKPYSCVECNRPFSSLYAVRKHMTSHEEGICGKDPLKFQCHVCGASYARKFALRDHLKSHGQNIPPAPDKTCSDDSSSDMS